MEPTVVWTIMRRDLKRSLTCSNACGISWLCRGMLAQFMKFGIFSDSYQRYNYCCIDFVS